jgi:hypothetical protein
VVKDPQLDLFARSKPAAAVSWLERFLLERPDWWTAAGILTAAGRPVDEGAKRTIRQAATESHLVISGQRGYKHLEHATAEEIDHAANWLRSQGEEMINRSVAIRIAAHSRIG